MTQGAGKTYSKRLLPQKPPSFSEEKEAKDFLKRQGAEKAYSKTLLLQKPPGKDGRLFPFARESAFISSLGSKNARYAPGVFRFAFSFFNLSPARRADRTACRAISPREARFHPSAGRISLPRAGGERLSLPPEGPNPQKVLRTFPGTPPGRCRGLPRRKEFAFFRRAFSCRKTRQNFVKNAQNLVKLKSQAEMITKTTRKKPSNMTNLALKIKYNITKSAKSQAQNSRK